MKILRSLSLLLALALVGVTVVACGEEEGGDAAVDQAPAADVAEDVAEEDVAEEEGEYEEEGTYEAIEFTLVNDTDRPILEFYVSPPGDEVWGENLIPEDAYIGERSEIQVFIDDGQPDCAYDILAVLGPSADDSVGEGELIQTGVEICDGATYVYSEG